MMKEDLINKVYDKTNVTKEQAKDVVDAIFGNAHGYEGAIIEAVDAGDTVRLAGFGQFNTSKRKERNGRNPQNGAPVTIPAKVVPKFTPGKRFKDSVAHT